jgi:hypothetical protein
MRTAIGIGASFDEEATIISEGAPRVGTTGEHRDHGRSPGRSTTPAANRTATTV